MPFGTDAQSATSSARGWLMQIEHIVAMVQYKQ
jgi:hypothetical protein